MGAWERQGREKLAGKEPKKGSVSRSTGNVQRKMNDPSIVTS